MLRLALGFLGLTVVAVAGPAQAAVNLVMNGDFETTTMTSPQQMNTANVKNWSTSGYSFIFFPGTADTTGSYTTTYQHQIYLWGPNNRGASSNALPATSPTGGNFVAADGAADLAKPITQTIGGLSVGTNYLLTFFWAGAQQSGYTGGTTESWGVSFGNQSYSTPTVTTPSHGFSPWSQVSVLFSATAASQVLSFLAAGAPNGQPPFSLLDGVSLVAAPEPATWAIMAIGLAGAGVLTARRRRSRIAATV